MTSQPVVNEPDRTATSGAPTALFVLSFRQRDELAAIAATGGWQVIAARRGEGAERRFLSSGAQVAVVDARGALGDGLAAVAALGDMIAAIGGALLVLVSRGDIGEIGTFHDAGATHFLASPHSEPEFIQALRFAARHAERLVGNRRRTVIGQEPLGWRYDSRNRRLLLTPTLAEFLPMGDGASVRALLRALPNEDRDAAFRAVRRLLTSRAATAFAHDLPALGRIVQHLQYDPETGHINSVVERLGSNPSSADMLSEALGNTQDATGARQWLDRRIADPGELPLNAMLIALNRFEVVNSSYGRAAGDALLRTTRMRIDETVRELGLRGAIVARMSGSEFLVAGEDNIERAERLAGRIAEALSRPFVAGGAVAVLGCRIGLATIEHGDDAASLLRRASEALADAKASDSVTVQIARREGGGGTSIDILAVDLRRAMDQGEIDILFQPQVLVSTGEITGVEALARWEHPDLGALGAETLFAAAERADLVIGLSDHIQRVVLAKAAAWPAGLGGLRLALNLTAADIARPGFADIFLDRVDASGFPRSRLTVEITESGLIEDLGIAAGLLAALRRAGCRVAIDDFGTGYSSLAYLKALPLDYLKIDKQLAQDIVGSTRDRIVVRGVIDMARSLGLSVVAEGVETTEQLDLLAKEGCQYFQGFLCAEPLDVERLTALMEEQGK